MQYKPRSRGSEWHFDPQPTHFVIPLLHAPHFQLFLHFTVAIILAFWYYSSHGQISYFNQHGHPLTMASLEEIVATNEKRRFAFNADKSKIRASQGHSIEIDLQLTPQVPPAILYHGTATRFVASIKAQGLLAGSRQHVHLSANLETASKVGQRHGKPIVLEVRAGEMHHAGLAFYQSENGVWLTEHVPVEFIKF